MGLTSLFCSEIWRRRKDEKPKMPTGGNNTEAGTVAPTIAANMATGEVTIKGTFGNSASSAIREKSVQWVRAANKDGGNWTCETDISEDELLSRNKKWYESLPKE